jgi:hypothetical protein
MRALLVALLLGVGAETAPAPPAARTAQDAFPAIVAGVETARGHRFARPIPVRLVSDEEARARAGQLVARTPRETWERMRRVLRALGMIGDDVADLSVPYATLVEAQVFGFFDPATGELVVRDRAAAAAPGSEEAQARDPVLFRELVRALQAQVLGLDRLVARERDEPGGDGAEAAALLSEGDAALTVERRGEPQLADEDVITRVRAMRAAGQQGLGYAPPYLRELILARYTDGTLLAQALLRSAGLPLLDRAFGTPPETTEQALHPEKYLAGERPARIALPADDGLRSRGYAPVVEGTLGELRIRIWAALWTSREAGAEAAAGWDGDRYSLYAGPGGKGPDALLWATAWDTEADAEEFEEAAGAVALRRGPMVRTGRCRVAEHGDRADAICRAGRQVGVVREAPADLAAALASALATASVQEQAPKPPLPGASFRPAALGLVETARGRVEGRRYVNERFGFALVRPAAPEMAFRDGPTSTGPQATPVLLAAPGGELLMRVAVLPVAVSPMEAAERLSQSFARRLEGAAAGAAEPVARADGRAAWAVRVTAPAGGMRVLVVAGDRRAYALIAVWNGKATDEAVAAMMAAQDGIEVAKAPAQQAQPTR